MRYLVGTVMLMICMASWAQTAPARPQFEVASVRPTANVTSTAFPAGMVEALRARRPGMIPMDGQDRVHLENWTLLDLIAAAYQVRASEVTGPGWLSEDCFEIEAKVPPGAAQSELNAMLQSLLEDRFGLKVHRATQAAEGYALVVGKDGPKLKASQPPPSALPQELTPEEQKAQLEQKMQENMAARKKAMLDKAAAVGPLSTQSFSSVTMGDLAASLVRPAGAPVVDATGLTGKYTVTIETWKNPDVPGGTIFDAVEKLGLKLEQRKVSVETVVVDEVSKMPTAN